MSRQHVRLPGFGESDALPVVSFPAIATYLEHWQPPALMVWGRHDVYFDLAEVLWWMRALPRMEAHVLDAGHLLLETHAATAVRLMLDFISATQRARHGS